MNPDALAIILAELETGEKTHAELAAALTSGGQFRSVAALIGNIQGVDKIVRRNEENRLRIYYSLTPAPAPEPEPAPEGGE